MGRQKGSGRGTRCHDDHLHVVVQLRGFRVMIQARRRTAHRELGNVTAILVSAKAVALLVVGKAKLWPLFRWPLFLLASLPAGPSGPLGPLRAPLAPLPASSVPR